MSKKNESLTSKERKALREQEKERGMSADGKAVDERETMSSRRRIFAIVMLIVAVLAVAIGSFIPTYMSCNYMFERNPVAVIKMDSNGKELTMKYELFINDSPIASTNFAFLASIGWFNGSVVYDTQNDFVRFGGYVKATDDSDNVIYKHRANDEKYTSELVDNFTSERYKDGDHSGMFAYKLNSDTSKLTYEDVPFALCSQTSSSAQASTEFQISGSVTARTDKLSKGNSNKTFYVKPFARPLSDDEATMDAVEHILGLTRTEKAVNDYFLAPAQTVTVKSVKVYNFSEEWSNVKYANGFESYMTEVLNGFTSSSTWNRSHI